MSKRVFVLLASIFSTGACGQAVPGGKSQNDMTAGERLAQFSKRNSFELKCTGSSSGSITVGGKKTDTGNHPYDLSLVWDAKRSILTLIGSGRTQAFCRQVFDTKCDMTIADGHLALKNIESGPGKQRDAVYRSETWVDIDLGSMQGSSEERLLTGTLTSNHAAKADADLKTTAEVDCERVR